MTDDRAIRQKAIKRSWVCPGAGFALVGRVFLAYATFVMALCILPATAWLAFWPSAASAIGALAVILFASVLSLLEQFAIWKVTARAPAPKLLAEGFVASSCFFWLAMAAMLGLIFTSYGSLLMAGTGMSPTFEKDERLLFHKHVDWRRVVPGGIIVYRNADDSAWGKPGWLMTSRIFATPGDKLSIEDDHYLLNGQPARELGTKTQFHDVVDVPLAPDELTVPDDCYFVVQDAPGNGIDSRVLSWTRKENILGSRLWYLSSRGWFKPVE